ncbi:DUF1772 domain-containing protein [Nonomuraea aridisoli]|uniref:DUF1772 domain-containing protein n=1 Tax=Nonomuraea aridisoli TaxID=2070368 RepID=A0A2W2FAY3_9ACTN|nr:DUF1772 domain-containing protein [Nonomuraea aridisoli]PZG18737.1 hypothetical protein C1J01_14220 [Nonomuraea aridisoli]
MLEALMSISVLSSAMAAGALLVGLVVILPLLLSLPVERYPETNTFILARMDKLMPLCTGVAVLSGAALAATLEGTAVRALYGAGALLLAGVFAVSLGMLGPINASVRVIEVDRPRADWQELRLRWRNWHFVRVGFGQAGAILYGVALGVSI